MSSHEISPPGLYAGLSKRRVEALTDGIFGTVMTILGLSLSVPYLGATASGAPLNLQSLAEGVSVYVLSFVFLGVYWVGHHFAFEFLRHTDRTFIWLNNLFLLCIGLLPLTTALIGRYFLEQVPLTFYGLNLIAIGLSLYATFRHATVDRHLAAEASAEDVIRLAKRRILMGPVLASIAILVSFVEPVVSLLVFVAMPILFILPSRLDALFRNTEKP